MKFDYVSFDFFDTLYSRRILNPDNVIKLSIYNTISSLYDLNELEKLNLLNQIFYLRKEIESIYYGRNDFKVLLKTIYHDESFLTRFPINFADTLISNEIAIEINNLFPRKDVHIFAQKMYSLGKKIVLISDTYHTKDFLLKKLNEDNLEGIFSEIFVSSENGLRKDNRDIYRFLLKEYNLNPKKWLHVGDNQTSDIAYAKEFGIQTKTIYKPQDQLENWYSSNSDVIKENFILDYFVGIGNDFYQNNSFKKNNLAKGIDLKKISLFDFGYYILGPLLYGFLFEVNKSLSENRVNAVFLSREGIFFNKLLSKFVQDQKVGSILINYPYNREYTLDKSNSNKIKNLFVNSMDMDLDFLFIDIGYGGTMSKSIATQFPNQKYRDFFFLKWPQVNESDINDSYIKDDKELGLIDFLYRKSPIFEVFFSELLGELVFSKKNKEFERIDIYSSKEKSSILEVQRGIEKLGDYLINLGFYRVELSQDDKKILISNLMKITKERKLVKKFFKKLYFMDQNRKLFVGKSVLDIMDEPAYKLLIDKNVTKSSKFRKFLKLSVKIFKKLYFWHFVNKSN